MSSLSLYPVDLTAFRSSVKNESIFSKFGCPDELICDNVPFGSLSMKEFAKEWNFEILLRSPQYPQSNGLAEKGVGIAKNLLKKSLEEGKDIFGALLQYRNTPLKHINYSPAQLLMSRSCKTKVPISAELLKPTLCTNVSDRLEHRSLQNELYFNKNTRPLPDLKEGQNVTVYNHVKKYWQPGQIVREHQSPRSFVVKTEKGEIIRRNRIDLRKSQNDFELVNDQELLESGEASSPTFTNNSESSYKPSPEPANPTPDTISGKNWKRSEPPDLLWYEKEDLFSKIKEPKAANTRGACFVQETKLFEKH
ncbi:uncharacterized protein LOC123316837 [Coccinella septempunctata]|uniref:uncharacterized protein LOC123316837 n=1 Tax=Coccinella septempunctata TaxID=41139 RepID=UPI001D063D6E|nr:uncharacterized protein LOC123316837 [Coccinella septempunctata]